MKLFNAHQILLLGAILVAAVHVNAQPEEAPIIQLINEMADKPENHQAIASYYRTMATNARAEAGMHRTMKESYSHSHATLKGQPGARMTASHCDRLIELNMSAAAEFDALAALHAE